MNPVAFFRLKNDLNVMKKEPMRSNKCNVFIHKPQFFLEEANLTISITPQQQNFQN